MHSHLPELHARLQHADAMVADGLRRRDGDDGGRCVRRAAALATLLLAERSDWPLGVQGSGQEAHGLQDAAARFTRYGALVAEALRVLQAEAQTAPASTIAFAPPLPPFFS